MTETQLQDRTVKGLLQFTIPTGETPVTQVSDTGGGRTDPFSPKAGSIMRVQGMVSSRPDEGLG